MFQHDRLNHKLLLIAILLLAFALRIVAIEQVPPGLSHDEAYNGVTAIQVLEGQRRIFFEINKGSNKIPDIAVNAMIPDEDRRVPFQNMIYIADGPSDIPVFSLINQYGGRTFAVYQPGSSKEFSQVNNLQKQKRVQSFGEASYTEDSQTSMWIKNAITEICRQIVKNRERALGDKIGKPPRHLE